MLLRTSMLHANDRRILFPYVLSRMVLASFFQGRLVPFISFMSCLIRVANVDSAMPLKKYDDYRPHSKGQP